MAGILLSFNPHAARADGLPAYLGPKGWRAAVEESQEGVIVSHADRQQTLIRVALSTNQIAASATALAWIIPVPAPPTDISARPVRAWPSFTGVGVPATLVQRLRKVALLGAASQLWPGPLLLAALTRDHPVVRQPSPPVAVLEDGIDISIVSARSMGTLAEELAKRGVGLPLEDLEGLAPYVATGDAFVVYRVANLRMARRGAASAPDALALSIEFPRDRQRHGDGYFPLRASSKLPGGRIDIRILTVGFMRSRIALPDTATAHYLGFFEGFAFAPEDLKALRVDSGIPFTEIRMVKEPSKLTSDLVLEKGAPRLAWVAAAWLGRGHEDGISVVAAIGLLAILGMATAILFRPIWPPGARPTVGTTFLLGLAHLLTLLGAIAIALWMGRRLQAPRGRVVIFVVASSATIVVANLTFAALIIRAAN